MALNCTVVNACNQLIIKDSKTMFMLRKVRKLEKDRVIFVSHRKFKPCSCCAVELTAVVSHTNHNTQITNHWRLNPCVFCAE